MPQCKKRDSEISSDKNAVSLCIKIEKLVSLITTKKESSAKYTTRGAIVNKIPVEVVVREAHHFCHLLLTISTALY